jgi:Sodium/hydrogen exchanger family
VTDTEPFALIVVLTAAAGLVAVLSNRLTERVKIPSPALVLAVAVQVIPALHAPPQLAVERVVTVALVCILFDDGMHIGWSRFRSAAAPIAVVGVLGTFLTAAAAAVLVHLASGLAWYVSLLAATAVAPTDPAVVFSVLGQREVSGRAGDHPGRRIGSERPGRDSAHGQPHHRRRPQRGRIRQGRRRVRPPDGRRGCGRRYRRPGPAAVHLICASRRSNICG